MVDEDPRRGKITFEYEELTPAEPDAALLAPPAGYTLADMPLAK